MKIFLLIGLLAVLVSCSKQDYSKPHEYIKVIGYGKDWANTENNKYKFHLTEIKTFFELGSGKCEKYLKELDAERVYQEMGAHNYLIRSEFDARNDILFKHAKLQCVAYHGQDQACETNQEKILKEIDIKFGRDDAMAFFLETLHICDIKKEIGEVRTFSLEDSKKFRYVER